MSTQKSPESMTLRSFNENRTAARKGGEVVGIARKDLEGKTGKRVASAESYLKEPEILKRLDSK